MLLYVAKRIYRYKGRMPSQRVLAGRSHLMAESLALAGGFCSRVALFSFPFDPHSFLFYLILGVVAV